MNCGSIPRGAREISLLQSIHIQPPIQWVLRVLSLVVKQQGCEADHSPPSSPLNEWSYTSVPPTCLMVCIGTTFTFTLSPSHNPKYHHYITCFGRKVPYHYSTTTTTTTSSSSSSSSSSSNRTTTTAKKELIKHSGLHEKHLNWILKLKLSQKLWASLFTHTHIWGHYFTWQLTLLLQPGNVTYQHLLIFLFAMSQGLCISIQYTAANITFLLTIFKEGAGNSFLQFTLSHLSNTLFTADWSFIRYVNQQEVVKDTKYCNNFTNTCTIHLFITYTRLHVSASPGHHQGVTDYQRLQFKMRKYE
jgi:hypothetical protein